MVTAAYTARIDAVAPVASVAGRLGAYLLDWLVTFIVSCVLLSAGGLIVLLSSDMGRRDPSDGALNAALVVASLIAPVWFMLTLAGWVWQGQTIGKLALRLRIVGPTGEPPGVGRALVRLFVYLLSNLPVAALLPGLALLALLRRQGEAPLQWTLPALALLTPTVLSFLLLLFDHQHRALHDRVAGTRVLSE